MFAHIGHRVCRRGEGEWVCRGKWSKRGKYKFKIKRVVKYAGLQLIIESIEHNNIKNVNYLLLIVYK